MIPPASRDQLLEAIRRFDSTQRDTPNWENWEAVRSHKFALLHEGRRYPVKQIIHQATGAPLRSLDGGDEAIRFVKERGFTVIPLRETELAQDLSSILEAILRRGGEVLRPGEGASDDELKGLFRTAVQSLQFLVTDWALPSIRVDGSVGKGRYAAVPWIALMDEQETTSTRKGVYCVFLFREDMAGVYLTLMQGVTELIEEFKTRRAREVAAERANLMRARVSDLLSRGFALDDSIDLHTKAGYAPDYEAATVAHKLYLRDQVPSSDVILADLRALLEAYQNLLSRPTTPDRPTQTVRCDVHHDPTLWPDCYAHSILTFPADKVGDLKQYTSAEQVRIALTASSGAEYEHIPSVLNRRAGELWAFRNLLPGDKVVATQGASTILAVGDVIIQYSWQPAREVGKHILGVQWDASVAKRIPRQQDWSTTLISPVPAHLQPVIQRPGAGKPARKDLVAIQKAFSNSLRLSHIEYGLQHEALVRSFVASLATKRFVILTGLSGSGKTQIALRFGDWLGKERRMLVPVRPDWTGPEALFGYEDALRVGEDGRKAWHVPAVLKFMLSAAGDPDFPYLLILDEMNLAHVERYFADFLSGAESGEPCLPNLEQGRDSSWYGRVDGPSLIPIPENLLVVGTVNVDETTYMFSPKVLDRANTFEFRVNTTDLEDDLRKPLPGEPGDDDLIRGFLAIATDEEWHRHHPAAGLGEFTAYLRQVHEILTKADFEFGHRAFYEAIRYLGMLHAAGERDALVALDNQVLQKVLPRLHGSVRRLESTLRALGQFCFDLTYQPDGEISFDPLRPPAGEPRLPLAFRKLQRMYHNLRVNQFTSFTG